MEENAAYYFLMKCAYVVKMFFIIVLNLAFLKENQGIVKINALKYMDMKESMFVKYWKNIYAIKTVNIKEKLRVVKENAN